MKIEILNWEKYNPRKDVKNSSWFRLEHSLIDCPDFFDFTHGEFKSLIYILSFASRKNSNTIILNFNHADKVSNINQNEMLSAIKKLIKLQFVTVDDTEALRERTSTNERTRRDERDETNGRVAKTQLTVRKNNQITEGSEIWLAYANAYASKYKTQPTRNTKTNSICKRLFEYVGKEKAIELAKHYLNINDQWYLKNYHKLDFLLTDYQKIITNMETGIKINTTNARKFEERQETFEAIDRGFEIFNKLNRRDGAESNSNNKSDVRNL